MPRGLEPVVVSGARVLVLGSLPSQMSIELQQYYGNPRNALWRIAEALLGVPCTLAYEQRVAALGEAGVALWDVLASAQRQGSLDSSIVRGTEVPNDIAGLVQEYPTIESILLNGTAAAALFRRFSQADVLAVRPEIRIVPMPSTSPANTRPLAEKQAEWAVLATALRNDSGP